MHPLHRVLDISKCGEPMKQLFIIILALLILTVTGCATEQKDNKGYTDTSSVITNSQENNNTSQSDETTASDNSTSTERSENPPDTSSDNSIYKPQMTETTAENNKKEPTSSAGTSTSTGTTDKKQTVSDTTSSTTLKPPTPNSDVVIEPNATTKDADKIAEKVVEYINEYRNNEGVSNTAVLSGLTKYAKYRSQQLVTNFAHDTLDERAAATALKYGEYVDPPLYGMTDEPYYTANVREAIGKGSLFGTIEQTAKRIAKGFKNSQGHWSYVGNSEYKYMAVGITCKNGYWYCDIAVSTLNTDN